MMDAKIAIIEDKDLHHSAKSSKKKKVILPAAPRYCN